MQQTIINAKEHATRGDLENYVRNAYGLTPDHKPNIVIQGTKEELANLSLSDTNTFWGISVSVTDFPTQAQIPTDVDRGIQMDFGINEANNKIIE